jgi:HEPN domain-containing protein
LPRKTDTNNPGDWLDICMSDLEGIRLCGAHEVSYALCRSKLAEVIEKLMKAELVRLGWVLKKTHELDVLLDELRARNSPLAAALDPLAAEFAEVYFTSRYAGFDLEDADWPPLRTQIDVVTELAEEIRSRLPSQP